MIPDGMTPTRRAQLAFWTGFHEYAGKRARHIRPAKPAPTSWMHLVMKRTGFHLRPNAITTGGGAIRIDFVITSENPQRFHLLRSRKDEIAGELGIEEALEWYGDSNPKQRGFRIRTAVDWREEGNRAWCYRWLVSRLERCCEVLEPSIARLACV